MFIWAAEETTKKGKKMTTLMGETEEGRFLHQKMEAGTRKEGTESILCMPGVMRLRQAA